MKVRLFTVALLLLTFQIAMAFSGEARTGKFVTIEGQEIGFFQIEGRSIIKGWLNGTAIDIPMDTVSQVIFFDSPNVNYSMFGNDISSGNIEVIRKADGKKFMIQDAFLPSDCDCTYITFTYRNPFTEEINQGNTALDGLRKIVFDDGLQ